MFVDLWEGLAAQRTSAHGFRSHCSRTRIWRLRLQDAWVLMNWFCAPAMVKEELEEQAESIGTAKRPHISQDNPEISRPCFQSRLTEWSDQCLRFQTSGEKWVPTKPCCPASPFLGLEACLLQGCKKQAATACVQLLSIEELCDLHQFFCKNPRHALFERQPEFSSGSKPGPDVICMKMRPWMPDLPTELWVGNGYLLAEDGMLQLSPTGAASAIPCREVPESVGHVTECDEKPSEAVFQRPTKKRAHGGKAKKLRQKTVGAKALGSAVSGVSYDKQSRKWRVRKWDPAIKKSVFRGSFALKKEAEAKARELGNKIRRRPKLSGSAVRGVYYDKKRNHTNKMVCSTLGPRHQEIRIRGLLRGDGGGRGQGPGAGLENSGCRQRARVPCKRGFGGEGREEGRGRALAAEKKGKLCAGKGSYWAASYMYHSTTGL